MVNIMLCNAIRKAPVGRSQGCPREAVWKCKSRSQRLAYYWCAPCKGRRVKDDDYYDWEKA